jgi:hypothetical protein
MSCTCIIAHVYVCLCLCLCLCLWLVCVCVCVYVCVYHFGSEKDDVGDTLVLGATQAYSTAVCRRVGQAVRMMCYEELLHQTCGGGVASVWCVWCVVLGVRVRVLCRLGCANDVLLEYVIGIYYRRLGEGVLRNVIFAISFNVY